MTAFWSSRLLKNWPVKSKARAPFNGGALWFRQRDLNRKEKIMIYEQQIEEEILGGAILAHRPSKTFFNWRTTDGRTWPVTVRKATAEELERKN